MYEGDAPLAERRAAALALDRDLLRELLGAEELRELLAPGVLAELELELQRLVDGRRARDADELHDVLRDLGPQSLAELDVRAVDGSDVAAWVDQLVRERRAIEVSMAGDARIAAADDAARLRDALGVAIPVGLPAVFTDPVDRPLEDLLLRHARTHGPFLGVQAAARLGLGPDRVFDVLSELERSGRLIRGEFRPEGREREWCDPEVLRRLRRRSLAALRKEVEPVEGDALARFLPAWQGVGVARKGIDSLAEVIGILQGAALPISVLERDVLRSRMAEYRPADLDALCTTGELIWVGAGSIGQSDGRIRLLFRDQARLFATDRDDRPDSEIHDVLRQHLGERGASFWPDLTSACAVGGVATEDVEVLAALWDLVWSGEVTNDSLAPVRAYLKGLPKSASKAGRRGRPKPGRVRALGPPAASGRWSLVGPLLQPPPSPTEAAHATALQLLERYGVLTREATLGDGIEGGFAGVYPILKAIEDQGKVRRGYFVAGLGAAQFALPGAVDRLRRSRGDDRNDAPSSAVLAATDPANPWGAALPWPRSNGRPARAAGAYVVIIDGQLAAYLERGGRSILTFDHGLQASPQLDRWPEVLAGAIESGWLRGVEIAKANGEPVGETAVMTQLKDAGYTRSYKGWVFHP